MRILWISHFLPYPPKGGALQRSHYLLKEAAARHEVHLVSLSQAAILPTPATVEEALAALRTVSSSVVHFPIPSDRSRWRWLLLVATTAIHHQSYDVRWLANKAMDVHLKELAEEVSYDVIHVDTIGLWPYARFFSGTAKVLTHHNVESQMMARRAEREKRLPVRVFLRREAKKLAALERTACPAASLNLVVSSLDADRLSALVPDCLSRVVENGVDTDYFRPLPMVRPQPGSMVFVGGMNWYPNRDAALHFLREIWPLLVTDDPSRSVTFVGANPPIELRTGDPRIRAPGFVDDVRPYLAQAEIFVCPMREGGGTRLKILDALSMGLPLVASRMAVEGIGVIDGQHYLRADSPQDVVAAVSALAGDPALRRSLGTNGRQLVKARYAWEVVGRTLDAAYEEARALRSIPPRRPDPV